MSPKARSAIVEPMYTNMRSLRRDMEVARVYVGREIEVAENKILRRL